MIEMILVSCREKQQEVIITINKKSHQIELKPMIFPPRNLATLTLRPGAMRNSSRHAVHAKRWYFIQAHVEPSSSAVASEVNDDEKADEHGSHQDEHEDFISQ